MARAVLQPSVRSSAALRAAALALRAADKDLRKQINTATREQGNVIWRDEIESHARTKLDRLVLVKGARIKAGNPAQAIAASSRRPLSDGLVPDTDAAPFEFGTYNQARRKTYQRTSRSGRRSSVTRATRMQVPRPAGKGSGRVVYAAWSATGPRLVSLWAQIIYRSVYEAFGKD